MPRQRKVRGEQKCQRRTMAQGPVGRSVSVARPRPPCTNACRPPLYVLLFGFDSSYNILTWYKRMQHVFISALGPRKWASPARQNETTPGPLFASKRDHAVMIIMLLADARRGRGNANEFAVHFILLQSRSRPYVVATTSICSYVKPDCYGPTCIAQEMK